MLPFTPQTEPQTEAPETAGATEDAPAAETAPEAVEDAPGAPAPTEPETTTARKRRR